MGVTAGVTWLAAGRWVPLCDDLPVITEQAVLDVRPEREADFESAFATAKAIIAATPGFVSLRLLRCIETPNRYLLLVEWETLEAHTEGSGIGGLRGVEAPPPSLLRPVPDGRALQRDRDRLARANRGKLLDDIVERLRGVDLVRAAGAEQRLDLRDLLQDQRSLLGSLAVVVRRP